MQLQPRAEIAPMCAYPIVQYVKAKLLSAIDVLTYSLYAEFFSEIVLRVCFLKYSNELVQSGEGVLVYEAWVSQWFAVSVYCSFSHNQISMRNIGLLCYFNVCFKKHSFPIIL